MSRLVVDRQSRLQSLNDNEGSSFPVAFRIPAQIISFIFHPIFIPFYVTWFFLYVEDFMFLGLGDWQRLLILIHVFVLYTIFPLVTTLLLKGLGFIKSIYMRDSQDRIIPYIVCMIFYFWSWYVSKKLPDFPYEMMEFRLAIFIASILGLMSNIYLKVSMHAMAVGIMITFFMYTAFNDTLAFGAYIALAFLVTGLVCTSRLILRDHSPGEVYLGLGVGVAAQSLAILF